MDMFSAGRGAVGIDAKDGKVAVAVADKYGSTMTVYVETDVALEIARAIHRAAGETAVSA